jgi:DNA-binding transcriptional MerR regulator
MGLNRMENDSIDRETNEGYTAEGYAPALERYSATKDSFTIGEVVERLRPEFPTLSASKIRYLERRRLINLSRTRGGYRLFSAQDIELLRYILTLQDKEYLPLKLIKKRIEGGGAFTGSDSAPAGLGNLGDLSNLDLGRLQQYLPNLNFPASKDEVLSEIQRNDAPQEVIDQIKYSSTDTFDNAAEVLESLPGDWTGGGPGNL